MALVAVHDSRALSSSPPAPSPRRLRGHRGSVNDFDVAASSSSASPALLASASDDGTARLWDLHSGHTTRAVRWKEGGLAPLPVVCCAFDRPHPPTVLFTAHGQRVAVWDVREEGGATDLVQQSPVCVLSCRTADEGTEAEEAEEAEINRLQVSDDGCRLLACDDTGRWVAWAIERRPQSPTAPPAAAGAPFAAPPLFCVGASHAVRPAAWAPPSSASVSVLPSSFLCSSVSPCPHSNVCADVVLCRVGTVAAVASVGFDFGLRVSAADGSRVLASADVRPLLTATHPPPSATAAAESQLLSSASLLPLTNPPYPQCVAASPVSSTLLVGCCSGQLLWVAPTLQPSAVLAVVEAHGTAVVCVCYVGHWREEREGGVCLVEYWASAGSDRRLALWRLRSSGAPRQTRKKKQRDRKRRGRRRQGPGKGDGGAEAAEGKEGAGELEASDVSLGAEELDWTRMEAAWQRSVAVDAPVTRLWTTVHPHKPNCIRVIADADRSEGGQGGGPSAGAPPLVRSLTVWACGVSSTLRRYHVTAAHSPHSMH